MKRIPYFICMVLVMCLLGCANTATIARGPVQAVSVMQAPSVTQRHEEEPLSMLDELLVSAEQALSAGRLTRPESDNAYDRFRAVLMLDPGNAKAEAGLQAMSLMYVADIRDQLSAGRVTQAKKVWLTANKLFSGSPLILQARADIKQAEREAKKSQRRRLAAVPDRSVLHNKSQPLPVRLVAISVTELNQRSPGLQAKLIRLAEDIKSRGESVLIFARSDAEGRWIYQQLKNAAEGYRIRGDIRIGKPLIQVLPPFES